MKARILDSHLWTEVAGLEAERSAEPLERREVQRIGSEARQARSDDRAPRADQREELRRLVDVEAVRLGHERHDLAGLEDVAIERHVDTVDLLQHAERA